jgi:hypothetical protein
MARIYSQTFVQAHDLSGTTGPLGPDAGFVWIIRGVDVVNGEALNEFQLLGGGGQVIWANGFAATVGFDYASYRGRYVVESGDFIKLSSTAAIDVSVWGYNLTAP